MENTVECYLTEIRRLRLTPENGFTPIGKIIECFVEIVYLQQQELAKLKGDIAKLETVSC